jgi:hypothetical protein
MTARICCHCANLSNGRIRYEGKHPLLDGKPARTLRPHPFMLFECSDCGAKLTSFHYCVDEAARAGSRRRAAR